MSRWICDMCGDLIQEAKDANFLIGSHLKYPCRILHIRCDSGTDDSGSENLVNIMRWSESYRVFWLLSAGEKHVGLAELRWVLARLLKPNFDLAKMHFARAYSEDELEAQFKGREWDIHQSDIDRILKLYAE